MIVLKQRIAKTRALHAQISDQAPPCLLSNLSGQIIKYRTEHHTQVLISTSLAQESKLIQYFSALEKNQASSTVPDTERCFKNVS